MEKEYTKNKPNLNKIFDEINMLIFDKKIWLEQKMWKIAEVTYSYSSNDKKRNEVITINGKKANINYTLFCEVGELNLEGFNKFSNKEKISKILEAKDNLEKKILKKKDLISNYISILEKTLKNTEKQEDKYKCEIAINSLIEKNDLFDYCINGLPFELEKAGVQTEYNEEDINEKQKKLDEKLFGGEILKNTNEVEICYNVLKKNFDKNRDKLTAEEKIFFKETLRKIKKYLTEDFRYKEIEEPESLIGGKGKLLIKDKNYIPGFNYFIQAYKKLKQIAVQNTVVGSISDGPNSIEFPKNEKFEKLTLERILKLNAHEIETHSITNQNNKAIIGNIKGAKNIEKDEGLAILMENLLEYGKGILKIDEKTGKQIIDINKIKFSDNFTLVLLGELLENDELKKALEIFDKIGLLKENSETRFLRIKRSNNKLVQHKDASYTRGLIKAVNEINEYITSDGKSGTNFFDLFLGKVGFEEIHKLKYINDKENNGDFITPFFNSDAILYILKELDKGLPIKQEKFLEYLKEKYPFLDFSKKQIENISYKTKKNILLILGLISEDINLDLGKIGKGFIKKIKNPLN